MTPSFRPRWPRGALVVDGAGVHDCSRTGSGHARAGTRVRDRGRQQGPAVEGLNVSDFVVQIDGVAQEIVRAEPATTPRRS